MRRGFRVSAMIVLVAAVASLAPAAVGAEGISSELPSEGVALVLWDGGSAADLPATNPTVASVWVSAGGQLLGYQVGAPDFVNAAFLQTFPLGELPPGTALIAVMGRTPSTPATPVSSGALFEPVPHRFGTVVNAQNSGIVGVETGAPLAPAWKRCSEDDGASLGWGVINGGSVTVIGEGLGSCLGWLYLENRFDGTRYWMLGEYVSWSGSSASPAPPPANGCDPSYPTVCIPSPPPDLNCDDVGASNFAVVGSDPHGFDGDNDGVGCES